MQFKDVFKDVDCPSVGFGMRRRRTVLLEVLKEVVGEDGCLPD
jgi:hypothetical protein